MRKEAQILNKVLRNVLNPSHPETLHNERHDAEHLGAIFRVIVRIYVQENLHSLNRPKSPASSPLLKSTGSRKD